MLQVSIITPSYNQGQYLEATIQSVLNQKYSNLQYIIIDGASSDNSVEIIKKYENHLAYWISEKDDGQTEAINKGLKIATGDIITWLNSDDVLLPNVLTYIEEYFTNNLGVDCVHGNTILHWANGKELPKKCKIKDLNLRYFAGMPFSQPSSFFRNSILKKVGLLNNEFHYGMDYDFFLRIALNGNIGFIDKFLSQYLIHGRSKTSTSCLKFACEWSEIFCGFLKSTKNGKEYLDILSKLSLNPRTEVFYKNEKLFEDKELKKIFYYFLLNQIVFLMEGNELATAKKIITYIKRNNVPFYKKNDLQKDWIKSYMLNKWTFKVFKELKRIMYSF